MRRFFPQAIWPPTDRPAVVRAIAVFVLIATTVGLLTTLGGSGAPDRPRRHDAAATANPEPKDVGAQTRSTDTSDASPTTRSPLAITIDPSLRATAPDAGRIVAADGSHSDVALDEVIVAVRNDAELAAIIERLDATVIEDLGSAAGVRDVALRIGRGSQSNNEPDSIDLDAVAADLHAIEPDLTGNWRFGSEHLARLLGVVAREHRVHGTTITLQPFGELTAIADGTTYEDDDLYAKRNSSQWSHFEAGGALDIGVAPAWQLLAAYNKLGNGSRFMVVDGGFVRNGDQPADATIRKGEWLAANPWTCSGGKTCSWHGTNVVAAAMAQVGNNYGTAGPAGVLANDLVVVRVSESGSSRVFSTLKMLDEVVDEERPRIINMSFGTRVLLFRAAAQDIADRRIDKIREHGALVFAAAGNEGSDVDAQACVFGKCYESSLWVPCEMDGVVCVGGTQSKSTWKATDSNYGSRAHDRSVDIYAPYCVRVYANPRSSASDDSTKSGCGTSYSSPFVAGVAALVWAASPTLSANQVWEVMRDSANVGGVSFVQPFGSQRRINAFTAVSAALGVTPEPPTIVITKPSTSTRFPIGTWVDMNATAHDFMGNELGVSWASNRDGSLTPAPTRASFSAPLSAGRHELIASTVDSLGRRAHATVRVDVAAVAPEVTILAPVNGSEHVADRAITLVGSAENPDTFASLPEAAYAWRVFRVVGNDVDATGVTVGGPLTEIPASALTPGTYRLELGAIDQGQRGSATVTFVVVAPDPDNPAPHAVIVDPDVGDEYFTDGTVSVSFRGYGVVPATPTKNSVAIAGTRLRWTARSDAGETKVLCVGSNYPGALPPGSIATFNDCSQFDAGLGLGGGVGNTTWTITLQAIDAQGRVAVDTVAVVVSFVTG